MACWHWGRQWGHYTIPYITAQNVAGTDVRSLPAVAMEVVGTNVISPSGSGANPAYVAET